MSDFAVGLLGNFEGKVKLSNESDLVFARIPDPKAPYRRLKCIVVWNKAVPSIYGLKVVIRGRAVFGVYKEKL